MQSSPVRSTASLSLEEYLELEEHCQTRHEFVCGEIYPVAQATENHNLIVGNIFGHLWNAAKVGSCRMFANDMKLRVADDIFYYPDVMLVCDSADSDPLFKTRPNLIAEVLSESTETTDKHEKLFFYQQLDRLQTYLIVSQDRRHVIRHWRDEDGNWWRADLTGDGTILVAALKTGFSVGDIYRGVF